MDHTITCLALMGTVFEANFAGWTMNDHVLAIC
jgi:hypothetical protein